MKARITLALLCLCASVVQAQPRGAALLLPSVPVANVQTNRQRYLVWDSSEPQFGIYIGTNRAGLVKRATISTNSFPITNGAVYGVSAINVAGVESVLAYWPSNSQGVMVWKYSTNLTTWITGGVLESYTGKPKTPQMYLRVDTVITNWLPPN
jgi:hypothetical protein